MKKLGVLILSLVLLTSCTKEESIVEGSKSQVSFDGTNCIIYDGKIIPVQSATHITHEEIISSYYGQHILLGDQMLIEEGGFDYTKYTASPNYLRIAYSGNDINSPDYSNIKVSIDRERENLVCIFDENLGKYITDTIISGTITFYKDPNISEKLIFKFEGMTQQEKEIKSESFITSYHTSKKMSFEQTGRASYAGNSITLTKARITSSNSICKIIELSDTNEERIFGLSFPVNLIDDDVVGSFNYESGSHIVDPWLVNSDRINSNTESYAFTSGTVNITKDDPIYRIDFEFYAPSCGTVEGYWEGEIKDES